MLFSAVLKVLPYFIKRSQFRKLFLVLLYPFLSPSGQYRVLGILGETLNSLGEHSVAYLLLKTVITREDCPASLHYFYTESMFYTGRFQEGMDYVKTIKNDSFIDLENFQKRHGFILLDSAWVRNIGHITQLSAFKIDQLLGSNYFPRVALEKRSLAQCANLELFNYWHDLIEIVEDYPANTPRMGVSYMLAVNGKQFYYQALDSIYKLWHESNNSQPLLKLSPLHISSGHRFLDKMGITMQDWFVCMHIRETGYHSDQHWDRTRNSDPHTYISAIQEIILRGGWVIRMGDASMSTIPFVHDRFIDYAHSPFKSPLLDVFLAASCHFFIGTGSGLSEVPKLFGVNTIFLNWAVLNVFSWSASDIIIPKKLVLNKYLDQRFIDICGESYGSSLSLKFLHDAGIILLDLDENLILDSIKYVLDNDPSIWSVWSKEELEIHELRKSRGCLGHARLGLPAIRQYSLLSLE
jgi:putative glycosyltransferase (TIGR04372 family)